MRHKIFIAFLSLLTATSTLDMAKAQMPNLSQSPFLPLVP